MGTLLWAMSAKLADWPTADVDVWREVERARLQIRVVMTERQNIEQDFVSRMEYGLDFDVRSRIGGSGRRG